MNYNSEVTIDDNSCEYPHGEEEEEEEPIEASCGSEHLDLCENELDCAGAGGYWYDEKCNEAAACEANWSCIDWTPLPETVACGETFTQSRTCADSNNCGIEEGKPAEEQEAVGTDDSVCGSISCDTSLNLVGSDCQNTCVEGSCQTCTPTCNCIGGYQKDDSGACQPIESEPEPEPEA